MQSAFGYPAVSGGLAAGSMPCFMLFVPDGALAPPTRRRQLWDRRCNDILQQSAPDHTNAEITDLIEAETGMRFHVKTVSERRATLSLDCPRRNDWTAPLRRWRPWVPAPAPKEPSKGLALRSPTERRPGPKPSS